MPNGGTAINDSTAKEIFDFLNTQPDVSVAVDFNKFKEDFIQGRGSRGRLHGVMTRLDEEGLVPPNIRVGSFNEFSDNLLLTPAKPIVQQPQGALPLTPQQTEQIRTATPELLQGEQNRLISDIDAENQQQQLVSTEQAVSGDPVQSLIESGIPAQEEDDVIMGMAEFTPYENILIDKQRELNERLADPFTTATAVPSAEEQEQINKEIEQTQENIRKAIDVVTPSVQMLDDEVGRQALRDNLMESGFSSFEADAALAHGMNLFLESKIKDFNIQEQERALERHFGAEMTTRDIGSEEIIEKLNEDRINFVQNNIFSKAEVETFDLLKELGDIRRKEVITTEETDREKEINARLHELRGDVSQLFDPATGKLVSNPNGEQIARYNEFREGIETGDVRLTFRDNLADAFHRSYALVNVIQQEMNAAWMEQKTLTSAIDTRQLPLFSQERAEAGKTRDKLRERVTDVLRPRLIKAKQDLYASSRAFLLNEDAATVSSNWWNVFGKSALEGLGSPLEIQPDIKTNLDYKRWFRRLAQERALPVTDEQIKKMESTFEEDLAETIGGFVGITPWLIGSNIATGGVSNVIGLSAAIRVLGASKNPLRRMFGFMLRSGLEEVKLGVIGFPGGVGTGFTVAGDIVQRGKMRFTGRIGAILRPLVEGGFKGIFGGAGGSDLGALITSTGQALLQDKDFNQALEENGFGILALDDKRDFAEIIAFMAFGTVHSVKLKEVIGPDKLRRMARTVSELGMADAATDLRRQAKSIEDSRDAERKEIDKNNKEIRRVELPRARPAEKFELEGKEVTREEFEARLAEPEFLEQAKAGEIDFKVENAPDIMKRIGKEIGVKPITVSPREGETAPETALRTMDEQIKSAEAAGNKRVADILREQKVFLEERVAEERVERGEIERIEEEKRIKESIEPLEKKGFTREEAEKLTKEAVIEIKEKDFKPTDIDITKEGGIKELPEETKKINVEIEKEKKSFSQLRDKFLDKDVTKGTRAKQESLHDIYTSLVKMADLAIDKGIKTPEEFAKSIKEPDLKIIDTAFEDAQRIRAGEEPSIIGPESLDAGLGTDIRKLREKDIIVERQNVIKNIREGTAREGTAQIEDIREGVEDFANKNLSEADRKEVIDMSNKAETVEDLIKLSNRIETKADEVERKNMIDKVSRELAKPLVGKKRKTKVTQEEIDKIEKIKKEFTLEKGEQKFNTKEELEMAKLDVIEELNKLKEKDEPPDSEKLQKLESKLDRLNNTNFEFLTTAELKGVFDNIKQIKEDGRTMVEKKNQEFREEADDAFEKLSTSLEGPELQEKAPDKGLIRKTISKLAKAAIFGKIPFVSAFTRRHLTRPFILNMLDSASGTKRFKGAFHEILGGMYEEARNRELQINNEIFDTIAKKIKELGIEGSFMREFKIDGKNFTKTELMEWYASKFDNTKNLALLTSGVARLLEKRGIRKKFFDIGRKKFKFSTKTTPSEQVKEAQQKIDAAIEEHLTPEEKAFAEWTIDLVRDLRDPINDAHLDKYGISMHFEEGHGGGIKRERSYLRDEDINIGFENSDYALMSVPEGFLKGRKKSTIPLRTDIIGNLFEYVARTTHFRTYHNTVKISNALLNRMREPIKDKYGPDYFEMLKSLYKDVASDGRFRIDDLQRELLGLRKNLTVAYLGAFKGILGNLVVPQKQVISLTAYLTQSGTSFSDLAKGATEFTTNRKTWLDFWVRNAPQLGERFKRLGFSREFSEAKLFEELRRSITGKKTRSDELMTLISIADTWTVGSGATASYLAEAKRLGFSKKQALKTPVPQAIKKAVDDTNITQVTGDLKDQAWFQRSPFWKPFTQFVGQPIKYTGIILDASLAFGEGRIGKREYGKALFWSWFMPGFMMGLIETGWALDDEDDLERLIKRGLTGPLSYPIVLGSLYNSIRNGFDGDIAPIEGVTKDMIKATQNISQGEILDGMMQLSQTVLETKGVPVRSVKRGITGAYSLFDEETDIQSNWELLKRPVFGDKTVEKYRNGRDRYERIQNWDKFLKAFKEPPKLFARPTPKEKKGEKEK